MSKKIIIAVFCCFALFACFLFEQKIYQNYHFSFLSKDKKDDSLQTISEQAVIENASTSKEETKKVAYLTFDDGPSEVTKTVLQVLKDNDAVATFFLIGSQVNEETKPILTDMVKNGNIIGIHTYSHEGSKMYHSKETYLEDFYKASDVIKQVTGIEPKLWRFPWGSANSYMQSYANDVIDELEAKGYNYYDWNVSAEDSVGNPTPYSILQNINKDYKKYNQPVLLMHDSKINALTARVLPQIIQQLKDNGYSFDTLDHMDKPFQWSRE